MRYCSQLQGIVKPFQNEAEIPSVQNDIHTMQMNTIRILTKLFEFLITESPKLTAQELDCDLFSSF
jgi:hypothetical protein